MKTLKNMFKKAFTLTEMLIVVIIIGILIASLLPKLNIAQIQARNKVRIDAIKNIKEEMIRVIKNNTGIIEQLTEQLSGLHSYCIDNNLRNIFGSTIYKNDPRMNHINYGTQPKGCIGQYGFIYNSERNKIGLITTLENGDGILNDESKKELRKHLKGNYNLDLKYYKNYSGDVNDFQNVFEKNNWNLDLYKTTTGNAYIEIIDLDKLINLKGKKKLK